MAILNATNPRFQIIDSNGNPLVGGKVYVYKAGTTTALTNWTDAVQTSANTQPVVLDSTGSADIWFDEPAKFDVDDANDVQVEGFPVDNINPNVTPAASTGNFNLISNGSFETDTDGDLAPDDWTLVAETGATIAIDTTDPVHGKNVLKFDGGGSGGGTATSAKFDVLEGGEISIQFTYYSTNAGTTNKLDIKYYDKDDAVVSTDNVYSEAAANPTSWTTVTDVSTVPATATNAELIFTGVDSGGGQLSDDTFVDDIRVIGTFVNKSLQHSTAQTISGETTFTDVPSWAKRITGMIHAATDSTQTINVRVRIGPSGGDATTGYKNIRFVTDATADTRVVSTTYFDIGGSNSDFIAALAENTFTLVNLDPSNNTWLMTFTGYSENSTPNAYAFHAGHGSVTLSGQLARITLLDTAGVYDGGTINLIYEG